MNIELWYDAVACETDVEINNMAVKKNDIFGFLYPVKNYPLQTWLYPNGSLKGLEYQLVNLARGEDIKLIFHGRESDYNDIAECLCSNDKISLEFCEWDMYSLYDSLIDNLIKTLKNNDRKLKEHMASMGLDKCNYEVDFEIFVGDDWYCNIYNDADLEAADNNDKKYCCYVHEGYFTSYDKLKQLYRLTRSLRMPCDGIYCCFDDDNKRKNYSFYAESFSNMRFNFVSEKEDYFSHAENKYGVTYKIKTKMQKCFELMKQLIDYYAKIKENENSKRKELAKRNLNEKEKVLYNDYKLLLYMLDCFLYVIENVSDYIKVLFSESEKITDETYHYECIAVLENKINELLNKEFNS